MVLKKKKASKKNSSSRSTTHREVLEEIIRVDHAGEYGATKIYDGQIAIFGKSSKLGKTIQHMADQEQVHIDKFNESYRDLYSKLNRWILEGSIVQFPHFEHERFIKNHWKNFQVNRDFDEPLKECLEFMINEIQQDLNYTFSELVGSLLREINDKSERNY